MKVEQMPLVSICVPTFNSARFLRETLDTLLLQSYTNREIIVSDNASTDETCEILREFEEMHGIRVLYNLENRGAGENFNRLIAAANGEYIGIYHADDLYHSTIVEESVKVLSRDTDLGLVGTMAKAIDVNGAELFDYHLSVSGHGKYLFNEAMLAMLRTAGSAIFFITPSIMVRTGVFSEVGFFDQERFKSSVDYEMWLRIARRYPVAVIDSKLMSYRLHEHQGSELEVRKNLDLPDLYRVILEYRQYLQGAAAYKVCDKILDRIIIKTALKQNYLRRFDQSTDTVQHVQSFPYKVLSCLLVVANRLHLNCHIRP
jgi:glycosyltransferase involved in cell wall biosynthesis